MKLTNKYELPESVVKCIETFTHSRHGADISVTELLKPTRQFLLQKKHYHEIEEDVSDRLWSMYGSLIHQLLENASISKFSDKPLFYTYNDMKLVGHIDEFVYEDNILYDYKFTSAWRKVFTPREWSYQLNIYKFLLENYGFLVKRMYIVALYRDYSKREAEFNNSYPKTPIEKLEILPMHDIKDFIHMRLDALKNADINSTFCSHEEQWRRKPTYALMRKGRRTAVKVYRENEVIPTPNSDEFYIEKRLGERTRCKYYCNVNKFCHQFQLENEEEGKNE